MAKVTVEVEEEQLRADAALRATVTKIMRDPKAKLLVQQAHRMVDATAIAPELDQQGAIAQPIEDVRKEFNDFKKSIEAKDAENDKNAKLARIQGDIDAGKERLRRAGWTEEGIKGVEAVMNDKGIIDIDIAAAYFEKQHPPQSPVTPGGSGAWNFMELNAEGDDDLKKLIETKGENTPLVDKMARDALNEVRGQSRR